ncbi:MAG: hypothetical protein ACRERU_07750 [Methylococcales bacterium]
MVCLAYRACGFPARASGNSWTTGWGFNWRLERSTILGRQSGAATLPLEAELIQAVRESPLLHADETSWTELSTLLW